MSSGIKFMNKRNTLPKRLKLQKRTKQVLELKNSINVMRNALESTGNTTDQREERISELKDRNPGTTWRKKREN